MQNIWNLKAGLGALLLSTFVVNALAPAEVAKVVLDEDTRKIEVVVPDEQLSLAMAEHIRLGAPLRDRITSKNGMNFDQAFQSDWMDVSKNQVLVVKGGKARKFRDALDWLVRSDRYRTLSAFPERQRNEIIKLENEYFNAGFNVVIGMEKYDDVRMAYEDLLETPNSSQVYR